MTLQDDFSTMSIELLQILHAKASASISMQAQEELAKRGANPENGVFYVEMPELVTVVAAVQCPSSNIAKKIIQQNILSQPTNLLSLCYSDPRIQSLQIKLAQEEEIY